MTPEQIKARAKEIGDRSAFPIIFNGFVTSVHPNGNIMQDVYYSGNTGMTYRMYLAAKCWSENEFPLSAIKEVQWLLEKLAEAELEAEQEVGNG